MLLLPDVLRSDGLLWSVRGIWWRLRRLRSRLWSELRSRLRTHLRACLRTGLRTDLRTRLRAVRRIRRVRRVRRMRPDAGLGSLLWTAMLLLRLPARLRLLHPGTGVRPAATHLLRLLPLRRLWPVRRPLRGLRLWLRLWRQLLLQRLLRSVHRIRRQLLFPLLAVPAHDRRVLRRDGLRRGLFTVRCRAGRGLADSRAHSGSTVGDWFTDNHVQSHAAAGRGRADAGDRRAQPGGRSGPILNGAILNWGVGRAGAD
jgi:hypothetical protein